MRLLALHCGTSKALSFHLGTRSVLCRYEYYNYYYCCCLSCLSRYRFFFCGFFCKWGARRGVICPLLGGQAPAPLLLASSLLQEPPRPALPLAAAPTACPSSATHSLHCTAAMPCGGLESCVHALFFSRDFCSPQGLFFVTAGIVNHNNSTSSSIISIYGSSTTLAALRVHFCTINTRYYINRSYLSSSRSSRQLQQKEYVR